MSTAYIVAARRTPVVPRGGAFSKLEPWELGQAVLEACLDDAGVPTSAIDQVILGNALAGGGNPARVAALAAGLPERVPALTVDSQCCSGLDAIGLAAAMVESGFRTAVLAGGVESYSRRPLRFRRGPSDQPGELLEQAQFTPWPDRDPPMHEAAAELARRLGIDRTSQGAWAVASHTAARRAREQGGTGAELVTVGASKVITDPFTRKLTPRTCQRARILAGDTLFGVDAATASVAADGAAAVLVTNAQIADVVSPRSPRRRILGFAQAGDDPTSPGVAPVRALQELFENQDLGPHDLDRVELMEAYAVQAIACVQGAELDVSRINRGGGSLARGHPIGASGAVLAVRLVHELERTGPTAIGAAAIAAAGGLGSALLLC